MELKKELSLIDVFTITAGSMICSGLFIIPAVAFSRTGPATIIAYLIAALIALPTMLSAAELATAMPRAGGVYFFVSRSMGYSIGTIAGFARWLSISLKSAFALIGVGVYLQLIADFPAIYISVALCVFFIVINLLGIKVIGKTQTFLTGTLMIVLFFLAFFGLASVAAERFIPLFPYGISSVFSTAGFVFISYGGMLTITGLAEEVKNPELNIPLGMLLALAFTGIIYSLVVFVVIGVLEPETLQSTLTPVAEGAKIYLGKPGIVLSTIAALLAFITTANAGIASASRYPLAMSRDNILPSVFQKSFSQTRIPFFSILFTGGFILIAIAFLKIEILVEAASVLLMLTYILTNLAVIVMREKKKDQYQPKFRTPFYPWIQIFGVVGLLLLTAKINKLSLLVILIFIGISLAWYWFCMSKRGKLEKSCSHEAK